MADEPAPNQSSPTTPAGSRRTPRETVRQLVQSLVIYGQWLLLRIFAFSDKVTAQELREGTFTAKPGPVEGAVEQSQCPDEVLELAKELYTEEEQRLGSVQDKTRALLSVCALTLPLIVAFMPRLRRSGFALIPLLFIFASLLILLIAINLQYRSQPSLSEDLLTKTEGGLRASIAAGYLRAARFNEARTDFLATVYRAAHRAFVWGLAMLALVAISTAWYPAPATVLAAPAVTVTVTPPAQPAPVVNVTATPSTQPAPVVNVTASPAAQPATVVNVVVRSSTQPDVGPNVHVESSAKSTTSPTSGRATD